MRMGGRQGTPPDGGTTRRPQLVATQSGEEQRIMPVVPRLSRAWSKDNGMAAPSVPRSEFLGKFVLTRDQKALFSKCSSCCLAFP